MSSTLVTNIIAAMQAAVNAEWTALSLPGSPPTISDSIGGMSAIYDTLDAYEATVRAPLPQTAAGKGQWERIGSGSGAALSLPAGGTWAYHCWQINAGTGIWSSSTAGDSIAAGGTQIAAGASGYSITAMIWRIA